MLDWIFEGIVDWVARTVTRLMDSVSGIFLDSLGADMTVTFLLSITNISVMQTVRVCISILREKTKRR